MDNRQGANKRAEKMRHWQPENPSLACCNFYHRYKLALRNQYHHPKKE